MRRVIGWPHLGRRMPYRRKPQGWAKRGMRKHIAARDGACCFYCGQPFANPARDATLDHLVPYRDVPTWHISALVLACRPCNQAKGGMLPSLLLADLVRGRFAPGLRPLTVPPGVLTSA